MVPTILVTILLVAGQQTPMFRLVRERVLAADVEPVTQVHLESGRVIVGYLRPYATEITPAGKVREIGRAGDGPGELRSSRYPGLLGDTVYVCDSKLYRVTLFPNDRPPVVYTPRVPGATFMPLAYFGDGLVVGRSTSPTSGGRDQLISIRNDSPVTIAAVEPITYVTVQFGSTMNDGAMRLAHPLTRGALFGFDVARRRVITVDRAEPDAITVTWLNAGGQTLLRRRYPVSARRYTDDLANALVEKYWAIQSRGTLNRHVTHAMFRRAFLRDIGSARHVPPVDKLIVAGNGEVWLEQELQPEGRPSLWTIIAADGRMSGQVEVPQERQLVAADGPNVLLLENETDLVLYHLASR